MLNYSQRETEEDLNQIRIIVTRNVSSSIFSFQLEVDIIVLCKEKLRSRISAKCITMKTKLDYRYMIPELS